MDYTFIKELINLAEQFESSVQSKHSKKDIDGFKKWICHEMKEEKPSIAEPDWEGKEKGRSPESIICTLLVHMSRYAKTYSRSAIYGSDFSTQEEFIYLINLRAFGSMTKIDLIRKNIQDKPAGMQIINRLTLQGWVKQVASETDKRSKVLKLTPKGIKILDQQRERITRATQIVTGDLTRNEKMELIRLLTKLEKFHHDIYIRNIDKAELLDSVTTVYVPSKN